MSATDVLRRMLDERGVEYEGDERSLRWRDRYGVMMQAFPLANGELGMEVWSCTPEQAIAATLGSSSCSNSERTTTVDETDRISISWQDGRHVTIHVMECSECGHTYEHVNGDYEFCPHCGRRVVEVDA